MYSEHNRPRRGRRGQSGSETENIESVWCDIYLIVGIQAYIVMNLLVLTLSFHYFFVFQYFVFVFFFQMRRPTAMLAATAACVLAGVVRAEAEAGPMMMMDKVCSLTHFFLVLNYLHTEESSNPSGVKSLGSAQELCTTSDRILYVRMCCNMYQERLRAFEVC